MDKRTTFALDETTILRLRRLAALWKVSQAEVVRRSLLKAEQEADREAQNALAKLDNYHSGGGLAATRADSYLLEVAEQRSDWNRGK